MTRIMCRAIGGQGMTGYVNEHEGPMKHTIDVYRDAVPAYVREELEMLRNENDALRAPRERLGLEGVTVGLFATGLTAWAAAAGADELGLIAVGIWCCLGGVWGVIKLAHAKRTL